MVHGDIWSALRLGLDVESHHGNTYHLPKAAMASLSLQAQSDLVVEGESTIKPFISEGDVLTA